MGSLISNNLINDSIVSLMHRQPNKSNQPSTRPVLQAKIRADNNKNTSLPKNIKKDPPKKLNQTIPK